MKTTTRWSFVLATVPIWPIGCVVLLASVARLKLGYWPTYGHPDPKDLFWMLPDLAFVALLALAPFALLVALVHAWYSGRGDWRLLLTACSFSAFVLWLRFDPGGLFDWVTD